MEKSKITMDMSGRLLVDAQDVVALALIAHEMRARFSDPRMNAATRGILAQTIEAVDELILRSILPEEE